MNDAQTLTNDSRQDTSAENRRHKAASGAEYAPWLDEGVEPHLRMVDLVKTFGPTKAVDGVTIDIYPAEFFALLGPSGCGKTTLLRLLAGFEEPDEGRVVLGGEDLTGVPPHERPVNMMFQSYALFPHMTVEKNISFGLQMAGMSKSQQKERVEEMLTLVHMEGMEKRKPEHLSGGQRQRVALARALAKKPKLLLLDEPLGALDRKLRDKTQLELVRIQEDLGLTFVIVTHDQEEAMTVSTRLAVMSDGRVEQVGEPREVYEAPASRLVAEFIGDVNILEGQADQDRSDRVALEGGGAVRLSKRAEASGSVAMALRPEKIAIRRESEDPSDPGENELAGKVEDIAYLGNVSVFHVRLDCGGLMKVAQTNRYRALEQEIGWDDRVRLDWDPSALVVMND